MGPRSSTSGQGLVEYALTIALIAVVVFVALLALGPVIGQTFSTINSSLANV
jgi:pilus assembly protein Flp/PilA